MPTQQDALASSIVTRPLLVAIALLSACGGSGASLQRENDALRARIVVLEAQVDTLRRQVRAVSHRAQPVPETIELPRRAEDRNDLTVTLAPDGTAYVNGNQVDDTELGRIAREAAPDTRAVISADRGAPHMRVVQVMDVLRDNGIQRFALAANPI